MPSGKATQNRRTPAPVVAPKSPPELVDPRWILKAGAAVFAVGLLCAYTTLCILFYNAQWQLVLHPSRTVAQTPASIGVSFQPVRFADDAIGEPQLSGWWIPGDLPSDPTVLMLHSQDGSMSDALPAAKALHDARLNVLLFDYRGYGQSAGRHPSESAMRSDAANALRYLAEIRHVPESSVIVYGAALGASLAVSLCEQHNEIPGLILDSADGDTETRVEQDVRSHIVPVGLLFHERFPLADALHRLHTPKLLISHTSGSSPLDAQRAGDPKITAELPQRAGTEELTKVIRRFLDTYVQRPPASLQP